MGHEVTILGGEDVGSHEADLLVALNAWRSSGAVAAFMEKNPRGRVIVKMTGTEMTREVGSSEWHAAVRCMERAEALVFLQEASIQLSEESFQTLAAEIRKKAQVIYPSALLGQDRAVRTFEGKRTLKIILAGNARGEKNPEFFDGSQIREALAGLDLKIQWYGGADEPSKKVFEKLEAQTGWFEWKGAVAQELLWKEMSEADLFLNISREEGGANAVCEAMTMGLPVVASRIAGNVGLLGAEYSALFSLDDPYDFADLLKRIIKEEGFYGSLGSEIDERVVLFSEQQERESWGRLIEGRGNGGERSYFSDV